MEPNRLEQILEAQIGNQVMQLAKMAVQLEQVQAELAAVTKERDELKAKGDGPVLSPV